MGRIPREGSTPFPSTHGRITTSTIAHVIEDHKSNVSKDHNEHTQSLSSVIEDINTVPWRNWYTRLIQVQVSFEAWEFDSPRDYV